jgi:TonB family protein
VRFYVLPLLIALACPALAGMCINPPPDWDRAKVTGHTYLGFTITEHGTVKDVVVTQSSGIPELDAYAAECVAHWRYSPAVKGGKAVEIPWKAQMQWGASPQTNAQKVVMTGIRKCIMESLTAQQIAAAPKTVWLQMRLSAGRISDVKIETSSGSAIMDERALSCAKTLGYDDDIAKALGDMSDWSFPVDLEGKYGASKPSH